MQFVARGPDIPEMLLEEHERGRVVFFCGAGISYPAGLPNFSGLVLNCSFSAIFKLPSMLAAL
jgi:NAD-dependent SIR2 family protein deacetylase